MPGLCSSALLLLLLPSLPVLAFLQPFSSTPLSTAVVGLATEGVGANVAFGSSSLRSCETSLHSSPFPCLGCRHFATIRLGAVPTTACDEIDADDHYHDSPSSQRKQATPPGTENIFVERADHPSHLRGDSSVQRRPFIASALAIATMITTTPSVISSRSPFLDTGAANALPFIGGSDRRQLELCLVVVLRVRYWALSVAATLRSRLLDGSTTDMDMDDYKRKQPYLEARLGSKALLTGRVGGGANMNVYKLASFQLRGCLTDGVENGRDLSRSGELGSSVKDGKEKLERLRSASSDIIEALGSVVEFDGLDSTTDPSPRSTLMLGAYTRDKAAFVYRTLTERLIPACDTYVNIFGRARRGVCEGFVRGNYADEVFEG